MLEYADAISEPPLGHLAPREIHTTVLTSLALSETASLKPVQAWLKAVTAGLKMHREKGGVHSSQVTIISFSQISRTQKHVFLAALLLMHNIKKLRLT